MTVLDSEDESDNLNVNITHEVEISRSGLLRF